MSWFRMPARTPLSHHGVERHRHDRNLDFYEDDLILFHLYPVLRVWAAMSEEPRNGPAGAGNKTC